MGFVENNIVKMQWDKAGWLQPKARGTKKSVFIFGSQNYQSTNKGLISVFFTATTAFLFVDERGSEDEDIWTVEDLIATYKQSPIPEFLNCEQYVAVIDSGEATCNASVLEEFGLVEFKEDIEARMKDVAPYGYEEDMKM